LESGSFLCTTLPNWQVAVDNFNEHDLVVEVDAGNVRYLFVRLKSVSSNPDVPVTIHTYPTPALTAPEGERASGALTGYRGCLITTRSGPQSAISRTLYVGSQEASFVVESFGDEFYDHSGANAQLCEYAVPGDFFVNEVSGELEMVYAMEPKDGIMQPKTTPVYLPDPVHVPDHITREMLDACFKSRVKVEDEEKLLAANVGSYFSHPDIPDRGGSVVSRYLHLRGNDTVTLVIVVRSTSLHYFYAEPVDPQVAQARCDLFDIVVEGEGEALDYRHIGKKTVGDGGVVELVERPIPPVVPPNGDEVDFVMSAYKGSTFVHNGKLHHVAERAIYDLEEDGLRLVVTTSERDVFQKSGESGEVFHRSYKGDFIREYRSQRMSFVYAKNLSLPHSIEIYLPSTAKAR
jgi:hypothetical protein